MSKPISSSKKRRNPYSKFQIRNRVGSTSSLAGNNQTKNVSFEVHPKQSAEQSFVDGTSQHIEFGQQTEDNQYFGIEENIQNEVRNSENMKTPQRLMKRSSSVSDPVRENSTIYQNKKELDNQQQLLKQVDQVTDIEAGSQRRQSFDRKISMKRRARSQVKPVEGLTTSQPKTVFPDLNNSHNVDDYNDTIRKDINDLKRQLSALSKRQKEIVADKPIIQSTAKPRNVQKLHPYKSQEVIHLQAFRNMQRPSVNATGSERSLDVDSNNIADSERHPQRKYSGKGVRHRSPKTTLLVDINSATIRSPKRVNNKNVAFMDPFEVQERLKNRIEHLNLDKQLNDELRVIKPTLLTNHDLGCINPDMAIPIETKRSLVSETSEFMKFYANAHGGTQFYEQKLDESLDNFIFYIKGLKNKFLEDLVLNKIAMVEDEDQKQDFIQRQQTTKSEHINASQGSDRLSNKVVVEDTKYDNLKDLEKEVDAVISNEQKSTEKQVFSDMTIPVSKGVRQKDSISSSKYTTPPEVLIPDYGSIVETKSVSESVRSKRDTSKRDSSESLSELNSKVGTSNLPCELRVEPNSPAFANKKDQLSGNPIKRPSPIITIPDEKHQQKIEIMDDSRSADSITVSKMTATIPPDSATMKKLHDDELLNPTSKYPSPRTSKFKTQAQPKLNLPINNLSDYKIPRNADNDTTLNSGRSSKLSLKPPKAPTSNNISKTSQPKAIKNNKSINLESKKKYSQMTAHE